MTDGNMGIQVTPVTKEDAMNLQGIFSKVAQALVDASTLPEQIKALQSQVETLSRDLQNKTTHAEELDKTVHELRQQRDDARRERDGVSHDLRVAQSQIDHRNRTVHEQQAKIDTMSRDLDQTRKDRDDYGMQVLALEDQVKVWKEKAEKARVRLNDVLSVFKPDEPEPEPTPNPTAHTSPPQDLQQPEPSYLPTVISEPSASPPSYASPTPEATPEPSPVPEVTEPEPPKDDEQPWWKRNEAF